MDRRLAAILCADVVGFSRLMGADEAGTLGRLKAFEAATIEPVTAHHGGRIVKRMGDGYLIAFSSVVAAVEAALAWQAEATPPLAFRIGIHLGDVIIDGDDLYGDGINVAARLEALAEPGGLCLSEDAQRQVRGKLDLPLVDLGEQQLKNISQPIRVFRLGGSDAAGSEPAAAAGSSTYRLPKILLAPFRPLGASSDTAALAEGVTETLAAALAHFEEFELIDPGSAQDLVAERGARAAGRTLDATYVLEGSLQLASAKVRIGVQLVEASSGRRVWSETFDRDALDVFALQDEITAIVASTLGEAVGEEQAKAIADMPDSGTRRLPVDAARPAASAPADASGRRPGPCPFRAGGRDGAGAVFSHRVPLLDICRGARQWLGLAAARRARALPGAGRRCRAPPRSLGPGASTHGPFRCAAGRLYRGRGPVRAGPAAQSRSTAT